MLQRSVIGKVLLQLLGVGAYFAPVVMKYGAGWELPQEVATDDSP